MLLDVFTGCDRGVGNEGALAEEFTGSLSRRAEDFDVHKLLICCSEFCLFDPGGGGNGVWGRLRSSSIW